MAITRKVSRQVITLLGFAMTTGFPIQGHAAASGAKEYQIKAAFLLNFGKFVDWPAPQPQYISLCVLGQDPFGADLDSIVANQSIHGRPIRVVRLTNPEGLKQCQILFVSASEQARLKQILPLAHQAHILTVSDSPQFVEGGGMIQLFLEGNHVRFSINSRAAESAGLKISSKLLQLSKGEGGT